MQSTLMLVGMGDLGGILLEYLVTNPKLILADEPTANLDHKTAYMVIDIMKKMKDESGTAFVFSTHDQKIVGEAEMIYMLEDGELADRHVEGGKGNG